MFPAHSPPGQGTSSGHTPCPRPDPPHATPAPGEPAQPARSLMMPGVVGASTNVAQPQMQQQPQSQSQPQPQMQQQSQSQSQPQPQMQQQPQPQPQPPSQPQPQPQLQTGHTQGMTHATVHPMSMMTPPGTTVAPHMMYTPDFNAAMQQPLRPAARKAPPHAGPSRPVGRPPLHGKSSGSRRGRPPRHPRPNVSTDAAVAAQASPHTSGPQSIVTLAPSPGVVTRPPAMPAATSARPPWTPSVPLQKQQMLLSRALQISKEKNDPSFMPYHALLQLGYLFIRAVHLPVTPTFSINENVVLRLDEASSLGVLPPHLASMVRMSPIKDASKPAAWPDLPTFLPNRPFVQGGAPPAQSAVGMPVTPHNTRVTRLRHPAGQDTRADWEPLSKKETEELRGTMDRDAAYNGILSRQEKAMESELYVRIANLRQANRPLPWWQASSLGPDGTPPASVESFHVIFPAQRQRQLDTSAVRSFRTPVPLQTASVKRVVSMPATLVPIRLDLEHEPFRLRDTFVWNAAEDETSLDLFAGSVCEDFGVPSSVFVELIKTAVQTQVNEYATAMSLSAQGHDDGRGHMQKGEEEAWHRLRDQVLERNATQGKVPDRDASVDAASDAASEAASERVDDAQELRVVIKIDILVGGMHLVDQFEWDLSSDALAAERFAAAYAADLGLAGEFKTAVAHSIREQSAAYLRSLAVFGYPFNQLASMDDEIRTCFLPPLAPGVARQREAVEAYTPKLVQLSAAEVMHLEREHEREVRRKRRQNKGRRGVQSVDTEPQKTIRSLPLYGFQGATPEMERPTLSRRAAAAAAASITSASYGHEASPALDDVSPLPAKRMKHDWYEMFFRFPRGSGATRARAAPKLGGVPVRGSESRAPAAEPAAQRHVRPEDLERQHPTMYDGVWHCANCGVPGYLMPARRKGPAGEKTLCGPCGKYFHRHRRMPSVAYSRDPAHHTKTPPLVPDDGGDDEVHDAAAPSGDACPIPPPAWLVHAVDACRSKYPTDRFHIQLRVRPPDAPPSEGDMWRIKCMDCPGNVYKPGPAESLTNFEIHLKNRSHRAAVARRLEEESLLDK